MLLTLVPLGCLMSGALGLMFGTMFDPRTVPMLFGVILIPITFLGCTYYSWQALEPIRWLQIAVLVNPLVYLSEGFRAALTPVPHMSLWAVYRVAHRLHRPVHLARHPGLHPAGHRLTRVVRMELYRVVPMIGADHGCDHSLGDAPPGR